MYRRAFASRGMRPSAHEHAEHLLDHAHHVERVGVPARLALDEEVTGTQAGRLRRRCRDDALDGSPGVALDAEESRSELYRHRPLAVSLHHGHDEAVIGGPLRYADKSPEAVLARMPAARQVAPSDPGPSRNTRGCTRAPEAAPWACGRIRTTRALDPQLALDAGNDLGAGSPQLPQGVNRGAAG